MTAYRYVRNNFGAQFRVKGEALDLSGVVRVTYEVWCGDRWEVSNGGFPQCQSAADSIIAELG